MELIAKSIADKIPPLYATEDMKDPIVYVKLYLGGWTCYITEISIDKDICFGYVVSPFDSELGYFSLKEISAIRSSLGFGVERDLNFSSTLLSKVKNEE